MGTIITIKNKAPKDSFAKVGGGRALVVFSLFLLFAGLGVMCVVLINNTVMNRPVPLVTHSVSVHVHPLGWVDGHPTHQFQIPNGQPFDFKPERFADDMVFVGWSVDPNEFIEFEVGAPVLSNLVLFAEWIVEAPDL